jgi:hypothetical protein
MAFNVAVIKDSGSAVINGARVENVTAQAATCLEIVAQDSDRDGLLIMNRDASLDIGITLIANPDGKPNATTVITSDAWAKRIARVAANTTEQIDVKAGTRVLISSASGTPEIAWQEVNA